MDACPRRSAGTRQGARAQRARTARGVPAHGRSTAVWPLRAPNTLASHHTTGSWGGATTLTVSRSLAMGTPIMYNEAGLLDAHACTVPSMATVNTRQQAPRMEERGG